MKSFLILLCFFWVQNGFSQDELKREYREMVITFIQEIENKEIDAIADRISFPFRRSYPIPDIKSREEFHERFSEVFDDSLVSIISSSNPKTDWSEVGWRGIMLHQGTLWIDTDGRLITVNFQSEREKVLKEHFLTLDKTQLHESLKTFEYPEYILETAKFRIRIDALANDKFRYASWSIQQEMTEKPDLILTNGIVEMQGSGGNHEYTFTNGIYTYIIQINILGTSETPPASLSVLKNKKEIVRQAAQIIRN